MQAGEEVHRHVEVRDEAGFSHFETELMARDSRLEQKRLDVVGESWTGELPRGKVHADAEGGIARIFAVPRLDLFAGFCKAPVADGLDDIAGFGVGDEVLGRKDAPLWMSPANECLDTDDSAVKEVYFRLVVKDEFVAVQGAAQIAAAGPMGRRFALFAVAKRTSLL